ncbi:MAG TPA: SRPBCC family protein [Actinoallomurus sp.]|nr:SRPBCC family protein [Actinoallomurus sp.]
MNFTTSVEIDADPERVWNALIDVEHWPDWTPSMRSVRRLDTGPFGPDSRVRIEQPRMPAAVWQVTRFEPGTSFTWVSARGGVRTEGYHRLVRGPDGLTVELGIAQTGALAWLIAALYGRLTRRYVGMEARGLKRACEPAT